MLAAKQILGDSLPPKFKYQLEIWALMGTVFAKTFFSTYGHFKFQNFHIICWFTNSGPSQHICTLPPSGHLFKTGLIQRLKDSNVWNRKWENVTAFHILKNIGKTQSCFPFFWISVALLYQDGIELSKWTDDNRGSGWGAGISNLYGNCH